MCRVWYRLSGVCLLPMPPGTVNHCSFTFFFFNVGPWLLRCCHPNSRDDVARGPHGMSGVLDRRLPVQDSLLFTLGFPLHYFCWGIVHSPLAISLCFHAFTKSDLSPWGSTKHTRAADHPWSVNGEVFSIFYTDWINNNSGFSNKST